MHIKENILEFDFEGGEPDHIGIDLKLRRNPELVVPFIAYMQGLEMGSEEYNKYKTSWNRGRDMKAGYFQALHDFWDFWNENKAAIRGYKLSAYDGVDFLLKKLMENRHTLFYVGRKLDIEITKEEMQEFRNKRTKKKSGGAR